MNGTAKQHIYSSVYQISFYNILKQLSIYLILFSSFFSCTSSDQHFLKEEDYRLEVNQQFRERKEQAKAREKELFAVFEQTDITTIEKEALEFLYAYMPLSDLADYDGKYFLNQVRTAFKARDYFSWGKNVPDELFRHFVLPYRVNNENLDNAREVFFEELKDRVEGLSMEKAVLEVNHWCHEKITYRGTDGRTSAPLALMKTSWGRCGEQSTFTTMALRAIGIPARQCYTPRWVHSDSNHAWVEAWVDGKWRYIGASEPEPEPDVAWFTGPAKRAMIVHTNVFGKYYGIEDKVLESKLYSIINVLDTYAETRRVKVTVLDSSTLKPVSGAKVEFEVYNFAEFYPIATITTNKEGIAELKTNAEGDFLLWVSKDKSFAYKKIEKEDLEITLVLRDGIPKRGEDVFRMHVPSEKTVKELTQEQIAANTKRLAHEDSIRNQYMSTFITENKARVLAKENNLDPDRVWNLLNLSQGNWQDISEFIVENKTNKSILEFLESVFEKDLRDTPKAFLNDHLTNALKVGFKSGTPESLHIKYIYPPRIGLELIRPWRSFLQSEFNKYEIEKYQNTPSNLIEYVRINIVIEDAENYYKCPISPIGVHSLKISDKHSRDIYFVALCRSLGIAARLEPSTNRPQYFDKQWIDVFFEKTAKEVSKGNITFTNDKNNIIKPTYSNHYSIAHFEKNSYTNLSFDGNDQLINLPGTIEVDAGYYRMTIGSRANDGSVMVVNKFFEVEKNKNITQQISLPKLEGLLQVQGTLDPNTIITLDSGNKTILKEQMHGKGVLIVFADPDKEPTKHILQDLPAVSDYLNSWGGGILFIVPDDKNSLAFDVSAFSNLPKKSVWATDNDRKILNSVVQTLQINFTNNFPLVVYANTNGGILFSHTGYMIGIGEKVLKIIDLEKKTKKN